VRRWTAALLIPVLFACSDDGSVGLDPEDPTFTYEGYVRSAGDNAPIEGVTVALFETSTWRNDKPAADRALFSVPEVDDLENGSFCPESLPRLLDEPRGKLRVIDE
jgi:hypothetical protein